MEFRGFGGVVIFSVLTHPSHAVCACADLHPQESYAPGLLYTFPTLPTRGLFAATTAALKPVLNWANCLFAEHTSDSSMNYNSFLK